MSDSSLIYCCPIAGLEKYWEFIGKEGQLFYDYRSNLLTFRKEKEFWAVNLKDKVPVPDIRFQLNITEKIRVLTYSKDKRYVAITSETNLLTIINIENGLEQKLNLKNSDKQSPVILFDWIWKPFSTVCFFVIDTLNIHFFKWDEKKPQLKLISSHSSDFQYAWFEPKSEIILVANTSGLCQTIFLDNFPKSKKYKGPSFLLDLRSKGKSKNQQEDMGRSSMTTSTYLKWNNQQFFVYPSFRNLDILRPEQNEFDSNRHIHKILFANMYGVPSLIHINVDYGAVFTFLITPERVNIFQSSFNVPPRVDNMIVINNSNKKTTFIYDTKKANPIKPVGTPQSVIISDNKSFLRQETLEVASDETREQIPGRKRSRSIPQNMYESELNKEPKRNDSAEKYKAPKQAIIMQENLQDYSNAEDEGNLDKSLSMSRQRDFSRKVTNSGLEPGRLGSETSDLPILLTKSLLGNEYNKNVDTSLGFDSQKEFTLALEDSKIEDAEGPSPYSRRMRMLDYGLMVDIKNNLILTTEINEKEIPGLLETKIDDFFFMIRRNGCKELAIEYLKKIIMEKENISQLSFIFSKLIEIYKKTQEERALLKDSAVLVYKSNNASPPKSDHLQEELDPKTRKREHSFNLKTSNSYNVIIQKELHLKVFSPLADNPSFDQGYLVQVLLEYFRISMEYNFPVLEGIQALFFKVILVQKSFPLLQLLLQFQCLHDSIDLAEVLVKLGMKDKSKFIENSTNNFTKYVSDEYYPEMFQLGVDMFYRLKKPRNVVRYLLLSGKVVDVLEFLKKKNFDGIDFKWFFQCILDQNNPQLFSDIASFCVNNVKKAKGDDNFILDESVLSALQCFPIDPKIQRAIRNLSK